MLGNIVPIKSFVLDLIKINLKWDGTMLVGWQCWMFPVRVTAMECQKGRAREREREREREGCGQKVPRAMGIARLAMNRPTCRKHGPAKLQLKLQLARTKRDGITVPRWLGFASTLMELEMIEFNYFSTSQRLRLQVRHENLAQTWGGELQTITPVKTGWVRVEII